MKVTFSRRQQIGIDVKNILNCDYVTNSPLLSSIIIKNSKSVPLDRILELRQFLSINVNVGELISAINTVREFNFKYLVEEPNLGITYPFTIDEKYIKIKNIPENATKSDFSKYVQSLTLNNGDVVDFKDGESTVRFKSRDQLFSFWRALPYVPFKNAFLEGQIKSRDKKSMKHERIAKTPPSSPSRSIKIQKQARKPINFDIRKAVENKPRKAADI